MAKKILVVDDSMTERQILVDLLTEKGYEVIAAADGTQAVMRAHKEQPDLILLDLVMPAGDGFQVCQRLKQSGQTSHIPIIVVTGSGAVMLEAKVRQAGVRFLLRKPVDPPLLLSRVMEVLGPRRA